MSTGSDTRFTFNHSERLKFRKQIETLFQTGKAFSIYPFRVVYSFAGIRTAQDAPARIGFSVPKKRMRLAVQRNRIKRLLREAWRIQKHELYHCLEGKEQMHLFLIFMGKELPHLEECNKAISKIINNLQVIIKEN